MRLDALLSRYGYCSRREAPGWIKRHSITFKGKPCSSPTDKVQAEGILLDGEPVEFPDGLYAALYKPEGYTCSHDDGEGDLIYDLLPFQWRHRNPAVSSVGRLDKETSGLLLLTDDGKFIHRMTSPRHHVAKVYEAVTEEDIPTEAVELFASGTLTLN
ncbi:MAG TPA: rRNA pseudouridine synthase, partial [Akkermansia muciniphila]|nr:rRNA pseudouridine synthase [Akkermansia muciniphila]